MKNVILNLMVSQESMDDIGVETLNLGTFEFLDFFMDGVEQREEDVNVDEKVDLFVKETLEHEIDEEFVAKVKGAAEEFKKQLHELMAQENVVLVAFSYGWSVEYDTNFGVMLKIDD